MEFNLSIKKAVERIELKQSKKHVIVKSSKWIRKQSNQYLKSVERKLKIKIDSDLEEESSYINKTRAIEKTLDKIEEQKEYGFDNILVIKNPYRFAPLCALALFYTKKEYAVKVTVKGKTSDCDISYMLLPAMNHRVPIMGLYADYENTISVELYNERGRRVKKRIFQLKTAPLKGKNADITVTNEISKAKYLYDLTLIYGGDDKVYPYAFDRKGDIRFCFGIAPKTYGFQPINKGKFLFLDKSITRQTATNPAAIRLFEVDQMGRFHRVYNVEKGSHHDFLETKKHNIVVASSAMDENSRGLKTFEDTVVELDRKTGNILREIKLKEYMDQKYVDTPDWAHLNSIEYNEEEKTVMVSLRNLHTVMKINYETKELVWILANPSFYEHSTVSDKVLKPEDENMEWFFQAHAAYMIDDDLDGNPDTKHMIIYDNHTHKRRPVDYYDNDERSFVRIYSINEKRRSVSLFRSYPFQKSNIRSNAVYEKEAGRILAMNGKLQKPTDDVKSHIIEFDFSSGEILNKYNTNYGFYRAYEFQFEPVSMVQNRACDDNYFLGKIYSLNPCEMIDVSKAKELPEPVLEEEFSTEEERKEVLKDRVTKDPSYYVDPKQDMARIAMYIEEDVLYVGLYDHQLERLYFVGKNHTYYRDYTDTKQMLPGYFARGNNTDPVPLSALQDDTYEIYFQHSIGLYKSGHKIKIEKIK